MMMKLYWFKGKVVVKFVTVTSVCFREPRSRKSSAIKCAFENIFRNIWKSLLTLPVESRL
jgi:hypothetical protein